MRSLQVQVMAWLLPGFIVVCIVAGWGVYHSAQQAIEADLDARLGRLAGSARLALRNQLMTAPGKGRAPALRAFLTKEKFRAPGHYFEIWQSEGKQELPLPNSGKVQLPRPPSMSRDTVRYDATLETGERVRVSAMRVPQTGGYPPLDFAVAISRNQSDARLDRLVSELVIGGIVCCSALCLLLIVALRFIVQPLTRVGEQAAAMGAETLHKRFAVESMPVEIAPIVAKLNDLIARLEESFERERQFSSYLAHELRTPLAAIRTTSEVAAKWPEEASHEDFLEIARAAAHLQQTVDSLLLLSRLETTPTDVSSERVQLKPLIEDSLAFHRENAQERHLKIELLLDETAVLNTDPRLFRIIANNLIANATEYAPMRSEILLSVSAEDLVLKVSNLAPTWFQKISLACSTVSGGKTRCAAMRHTQDSGWPLLAVAQKPWDSS
jgi:signal transduction histidine kinase